MSSQPDPGVQVEYAAIDDYRSTIRCSAEVLLTYRDVTEMGVADVQSLIPGCAALQPVANQGLTAQGKLFYMLLIDPKSGARRDAFIRARRAQNSFIRGIVLLGYSVVNGPPSPPEHGIARISDFSFSFYFGPATHASPRAIAKIELLFDNSALFLEGIPQEMLSRLRKGKGDN